MTFQHDKKQCVELVSCENIVFHEATLGERKVRKQKEWHGLGIVAVQISKKL